MGALEGGLRAGRVRPSQHVTTPHAPLHLPPLPTQPQAHIQILYGNIAPEGSVAKITGKEGLRFEGKV
jgi:dihydroxyacid dehydratase/phosphogluconate dehydratase